MGRKSFEKVFIDFSSKFHKADWKPGVKSREDWVSWRKWLTGKTVYYVRFCAAVSGGRAGCEVHRWSRGASQRCVVGKGIWWQCSTAPLIFERWCDRIKRGHFRSLQSSGWQGICFQPPSTLVIGDSLCLYPLQLILALNAWLWVIKYKASISGQEEMPYQQTHSLMRNKI